VRARVSNYTSGSASVILMTDTAQLDDSLQGVIAPLLVTATGAAAAAVTLTLPAAVSLRHYLTSLRIDRFAAALLTAAATPVVATTTNLPGALAFSLPADAAQLGTVSPLQIDYAQPLAASAQNTASTIVLPATPGVIWRATATYYLAP
jgi:hypothetical protein